MLLQSFSSFSFNKSSNEINLHKKTKKNVKLKQLKDILKITFCMMFVMAFISLKGQGQDTSSTFPVDSTQFIANPSDSANSSPKKDSISASVPITRDGAIQSVINYTAKDSIKVDVINQIIHIYGNAHVDYKDKPDGGKKIILEAAYIKIDWTKNLLVAEGTKDSLGNDVGLPHFEQGEDIVDADGLKYNFESEKAIITGVRTQEGESYIHGDTVMKNKEGELYIKDAKYTTCNLEHPHFYVRSKKMKMVPDKVVVSGPFHIVLSEIPTPLGFIFGLFPMPKEKASGIVMPSPRTGGSKGVGLTNGGYYWAINDYVGAKFVGDYFSNGAWRAELSSNYVARYKFKGRFAFGLSDIYDGYDREKQYTGNFFEGKGYMLKWNHSESVKNNSSFSANVEIMSPNYNRQNSINVNRVIRSNFNSNIRYSKSFGKSPFSMGVNLNQKQDDKGKMTFNLPDVNLNMRRQQPFKNYRGFGSEYVKNFSFNYSGVFKNSFTNIRTADYGNSIAGVSEISGEDNYGDTIKFTFGGLPRIVLENGRFGYQHNTMIQNSFKMAKYFSVTPNIRYTETYYDRSLNYNWNGDSLDVETIRGFNRLRQYDMGVNLNTVLYSFLAIEGKKIPQIRNLIRPEVGYRFVPDYGSDRFGYYQTSVIDTNGNELDLSRYNSFKFGAPSQGLQNIVTWSIANSIEIKTKKYIKDEDGNPLQDAAGKDSLIISKPFKLMNINLGSNYNFTKDSLKAAPVWVRANTTFKGITFNFNSNHSFYRTDSTDKGFQFEYDQLYGEGKGLLQKLRTTNVNFTVSTSLNPKVRNKKQEVNDELTPLEQAEYDYIFANPDQFLDFSIPWNMRVSYNLLWNKPGLRDATKRQAITASGDFSLSDNWKATFNTTYNIQTNALAATSIGMVRNLHCWEMLFNWIPAGPSKSITFTIRAKSQILQELKYNHAPDHALY